MRNRPWEIEEREDKIRLRIAGHDIALSALDAVALGVDIYNAGLRLVDRIENEQLDD